jgi:uncharacterized membrane protein YbhN (UPF0104 family)
MVKKHQKLKASWLRAIYLILVGILIYILLSQISSLKGSAHYLRISHIDDDLLAVILTAVTYLFSSLTYYFLATKRLRYVRTVIVELGINTLNRLLPAGIGGLGANYLYLTKSKHNKTEAVSIVALNNILGLIGNALLLVVLLITVKANKLSVGKLNIKLVVALGILVGVCLIVLCFLPKIRTKIGVAVRAFLFQVASYKKHKFKLFLGLVSQICLTLANVSALIFSLHAVNSHLALSSVILVYSFAISVGSIIPTPGGVGSVDAGLIGALVAYNLPLRQAVAGILVFRLINFWLPLILGIPALVYSRRKAYL